MATRTLKSTFCLNLYMDYTITQNVANNTSSVALTMRIATVGNYNVGPWTDFNGSYIGNKSSTFTGSIPNFSGSRTLARKTLTFTHNSDGTKTATIYWKWGVNSSWGGYVNPSGSFTITLPTIPRATTPTFSPSNQDIGETVTFSFPRASSSFTHNLSLLWNKKTYTICTGAGTSYKWTMPMEMCNHVVNSPNGWGQLTCTTKKGNTTIGSKTIKFTARVPDSVVPTISAVTATENETANELGVFVKDNSSLNVKITAAGAYSSTIKTVSSTIDGTTYAGTEFTTGLLKTAGTRTLKTTVTDSRGRTTTKQTTITVQDYSTPQITRLEAQRTTDGTTPDDSGEKVKITYSYAVSPAGNKNACSAVLEYAPASGGDWTTLQTFTAYSATDATYVSEAVFDSNVTYNVRLRLTDSFTETTQAALVMSEYTLIDYAASGRGMAFGKVAEEDDLIDVNIDTRFRKAVTFDSDTDWTPLTLNTGTFKPYDNVETNTPKYRIRGKTVEIRGAFSPKSSLASSYLKVQFATLPEAITPSDNLYQLCPGANCEHWVLSVNTAGTLAISQYGATAYGTIAANTRLVFQITYTLD